MLAGAARDRGEPADLSLWFRSNAIVASFAPWGVWFLKNAILVADRDGKKAFLGSLPILGICLFLAGLCLSDSFVYPGAGFLLHRGSVYFAHALIGIVLYLLTAIQIVRQLQEHRGIRRLELQYLALSCGIVGLLVAVFNGLGNLLQIRTLNRASIFVVFAAYLFMAWALANHRIFNARHVLAAVGHRIAVVGALASSAWILSLPLGQVMSDTAAWVVGTALGGTMVFWLDQKTRDWIGLGDERLLASLRSEVIHLSQLEAGSHRLTVEFERLLALRHHAAFASILSNRGNSYVGRGLAELSTTRPGFTTLCETAWITPESLQRRRPTTGLEDLGVFLRKHGLAVLITVPRDSPAPSLLVAIGTKDNEWPFTYPEIQRLQNIAELMDSILTRSRLTDQAAMQARMEHLAMMSRGLAHDLKNLITPVSSFLVHTEGRYAAGSAEAEVHAAARRSIRIMTEYLREALFFSERLEARFETIDLPRLFQRVREATAARAAGRGVSLVLTPGTHGPLIADGVLLLRVLANLINNAIDASDPGRIVTVVAGTKRPGWLQLQVTDEGRGIAPAVIDRIFDPYFTTKEFGEEVRGFGLGLTISQKIVQLHGGTIVVKSEPGRGTAVTIEIPTVQGRLPASPFAMGSSPS